MRRLSWKIAVAGFFALALAGALADQEPLTCTLRALAGAAVLLILVRLAGRVLAAILTDAAVHGRRMQPPQGQQERNT